MKRSQNLEISPKQAFKQIYGSGKKLNKDVIVVDIRETLDFQESHLPHSINPDLSDFDDSIEKFCKENQHKKLFFICYHGNSSYAAAAHFHQRGLNALSIAGGITDWIAQKLPTVK